MKTTNFFTEMSKYAQQADLKINISMKGDTMSVTLMPDLKDAKEKLTPFVATGTVHELDEGFLPEIAKSIAAAGGGFKTNTDQFAQAVKELNEKEAADAATKEAEKNKIREKKSAIQKKKTAPKKPAAKKAAPAKKVKPAPKKKAAPVAKKKPAPAKPAPSTQEPEVAEAPAADTPAVPERVQQSMF